MQKLLGTEFGALIAREFGIEGETQEVQSELLELVGEQVLKRVMLEILKVLPRVDHERFEAFVGSDDFKGLDEFLRVRIPDFDTFVAQQAGKELEAIKTHAKELTK